LPPGRGLRCRTPLIGSSLSDTCLRAEPHGGPQLVEGIVIDGERGADGQWVGLNSDFTIFTADEQVVVCHGHNCQVEIL
jgi:hypothetical protein